MKLAVLFLGALLELLAAQGKGNYCPHKKSATLLPSFTVTPTATESTASTGTTSHRTTATGTISPEPTTATHNPFTTTSHGNATVHPTTSNSTATSPGSSTSSPHPRPPPPSPSPSPGSKADVGDYTGTNGSQLCVHLQAEIRIRILYPTQGGGKAWGISVLNPNKTKAQGGCEGAHAHLLLSFPYGQLSFGFKKEPPQSTVYLNYMAVEYNVSFPQAAEWTFSVQNSSLRELQAPLGQSFSCRNQSIILSPAFHLDLLFLKLQAAHLSPSGAFGPSKTYSFPPGTPTALKTPTPDLSSPFLHPKISSLRLVNYRATVLPSSTRLPILPFHLLYCHLGELPTNLLFPNVPHIPPSHLYPSHRHWMPNSHIFLPGFSCPSDQSILLPLIIGLIALGLLTMVLVTFCIFRRRPPTYQPL